MDLMFRSGDLGLFGGQTQVHQCSCVCIQFAKVKMQSHVALRGVCMQQYGQLLYQSKNLACIDLLGRAYQRRMIK